jgi:hypothetical protein
MKSDASTMTEKPLSVQHVLSLMVEQMATMAWQKMGLQPDPMTGQVEKDISQAKLAIDVTTELTRFIECDLDEEDKKKIQALVRDLRINFVEQSNKR